jgi:hypothetical protein
MSFKTMTEANQEFVTKLYGLKAGLSLLSLQAEKMQAEMNKDKFMKDCLEEKEYKLNGAKKRLQGLYDAKTQAEEDLKSGKKKLTRRIVGACVPLVFDVLLLIAVVGLMVSSVAAGDTESLKMVPMFLASGLVPIAFTAYFLFDAFKQHGTKRAEQKLAEQTALWNTCRTEVAELAKQVKDEQDACDRQEKEHPKVVAEIEERTDSIYRALLEEYDDILDHRDWGSVDYLIYVYETMRADTLPGALDKLDVEKRANRLEQAIAEASEHVASSIHDSMQIMGNMLSAQLNELGSRVEASNRKVVKAIGDASDEAARQAAALNTSMAAQNALLAKANVSSASIAKDVGYMVNSYKTMGSIDVRLK